MNADSTADRLAAALDQLGTLRHDMGWLERRLAETSDQLAAAEAKIAQAPHDHYEPCGPTNYLRYQDATDDELPECTCWKSASSMSALSAVRADAAKQALLDAADWNESYEGPGVINSEQLRARAEQIGQAEV